MKVYYADNLKHRTFAWMLQKYPTLQHRVYEAMVALTPNQYQFIYTSLYAKDELPPLLNPDYCDADSDEIIAAVLLEMLGDRSLLLTNGDLWFCWSRIRELVFIHQAVKQGILVEEIDDNGTDYWIAGLPGPKKAKQLPVKTVFRSKNPHKYRVNIR